MGSGIIVSYGIMRLDPVLILGQSVGFIAYSRNILLGKRQKVDTAQRDARQQKKDLPQAIKNLAVICFYLSQLITNLAKKGLWSPL